MLPCRYILIDQQAFKGALSLDCVPINDVLMLHICVHQYKGTLTDSIVQSFDVNASNRNFFTALPLEKVAMLELSLNQSEELYLYLQSLLAGIQMTDQLHRLDLMTMTLFLKYDQIFKMNNFILHFIQSYETVRVNLAIIQQTEQAKPIVNVANNTLNDDGEIIDESASVEFENPDDASDISLLNDCLIMSPNALTTYFISKQIASILNKPNKEKIHFQFDKQSVIIHLSPLIQQELIEISDDHYTELNNIIASFTYSQEEYITKLRFLVRHLIYIVNNYTKSNNTYFITVKIIEFLILIYTIKLSPSSFIGEMSLEAGSAAKFKGTVEYLVNFAVQHVLEVHIDQRQITHNQIIFKHYPNVEYFEEEFNMEEVRQLISKELYLVDVDREFFINNIITRAKADKVIANPGDMKIIFNKQTTINIEARLEEEPLNDNSWLDYQKITPQQKQFENHSIITDDYLQLLQLTNMPTISKSLLKDVHPILTKYANIIINQIFKELSVCDSKHAISTLYLLMTHIRPYLHADASIKTEMYILYRVVIPHLYDIYKVNMYTDYFH